MNLSRLCDNRTPLVVEPMLLDDHHGHELAVAVAKLTWLVSDRGQARIALPQRPVRHAAEHGDESRCHAFDFPSDMAEHKPGTDIIMLAAAYPTEEGATERIVSLRLTDGERLIEKSVRVFGRRFFMKGRGGAVPGKAEPLGITPLVYPLAYGGSDDIAETPTIAWTNPVGIGHVADKSRLVGKPAYVIESVGGTEPAGFGPIAEYWQPRLGHAGTYDELWRKTRAPLRPSDFDPKHHITAHPDLWAASALSGDEGVEIVGATPEGTWRFKLPRYAPKFIATVDGEQRLLDTHLDTYLVDLRDPERRLVELTWRAAVRLPRKTERLEEIAISPDEDFPDEIYDRLDEDLARHQEENAA